MIRSMTGFARAEGRIKGGILYIEIKSFNHRFFEFTGRIPAELLTYEEETKRYLKQRIPRGSINLLFSYTKEGRDEKSVTLDRKISRHYFKLCRQLQRELGLKYDLGIKDMLSFPGVINYAEPKVDLSQDWPACRKILEKAVESLLKVKAREGKELLKDILKHIATIEKAVKRSEERAKRVIEQYRQRFRQRLKDLLGEEPAKQRLEEEAILFLRNADISEELMRIKSHLAHFRHLLRNEEEVGRKLDFICQELYREANTIGAKGSDFLISKEVVSIKSEIEKIREQVQNLE